MVAATKVSVVAKAATVLSKLDDIFVMKEEHR